MRILSFIVFFALISCSKSERNVEGGKEGFKNNYQINVKELTDSDYPDNPDIGFRSEFYQQFSHQKAELIYNADSTVTFKFPSQTEGGADITLQNLNIFTWMPAIPKAIQDDEYLSHICMVNQEWNRQQVKFTVVDEQLKIEGGEKENNIVRVDLARNCLNSGLWEIAAWRMEDGEQKVYYHGWFDFPLDLYAHLVNAKSGVDFEKYKSSCVVWKDPKSDLINFDKLRSVDDVLSIKYEDLKESFYPKKNARLKKYKNIVCPKQPEVIVDFLNDSTAFSTFSQPGWYNTKDPRKTELGRFSKLNRVLVKNVHNDNTGDINLVELELFFKDELKQRKTKLVFGGIKKEQIPTLSVEDMNNGFKMPMGIANHSFYEPYQLAISSTYDKNPYYGLILGNGWKWLDSHYIGIDGPLLHWDDKEENVLHLWLLSFERHAFVGHYKLYLNDTERP